MNQNPEQLARDEIDRQLLACGWVVQGKQVFAASADGLVKQFDFEAEKEVRTYPGHRDWVYALHGDAGANRLATGSYDGEVRIWDTATGNCLIAFTAAPGLAPKLAANR